MSRLTDEASSTPSSPIDILSALSIYAVLTKSHIEKLFTSSYPSLKISPEHLSEYNKMTDLFNYSNNYSRLRQKHKEAHYYVPSMPLMILDFTKLLDTDVTKLYIKDKVNIHAVALIGNVAMSISSLQSKLIYTPDKAHFNLPDEFLRINQNKSYQGKNGKFNQFKFNDFLGQNI